MCEEGKTADDDDDGGDNDDELIAELCSRTTSESSTVVLLEFVVFEDSRYDVTCEGILTLLIDLL